ncbi:MAG: hypothetical protein KatS3mg033_1993 [Thermonema sp.]|uniref:hypothetical protein n=1 Tax=Thermonema sp. TaxID=2231181 RepID=UPI0021DB8C86|nr:hypothetical protein [Thermonema sp.]GIV40193.1 MAG: hypothetical protein KatS3mg033_1993 [Thermonema sp.]
MIKTASFPVAFHRDEASLAAKSYMMSLAALVIGLPLPIVNLLATLIFFFSFRRAHLFVRWHAMQAMLSQLTLFALNAPAFWWTVAVLFGSASPDKYYVAYLLLVLLLNVGEFIATLVTVHHLSKQRHVKWWLYGDWCDEILKVQSIRR